MNFCGGDEHEALAAAGFLPRMGLQYHWASPPAAASFEDWLGALRSKRRNQVRRERRELAEQGVAIERVAGSAIPDALFGADVRDLPHHRRRAIRGAGST